MEEDRIKRFLWARKELRKRIRRLERKLSLYRELLDLIDTLIIDKSIVSAETLVEPSRVETQILASRSGVKLGVLERYDDQVVFKPAKGIEIQIDKSPFSTYFVRRVLTGWKMADDRKVKSGEITSEEMFDYEIVHENKKLEKIIFKNPGDKLPRILKQLRWTIEKQLNIE